MATSLVNPTYEVTAWRLSCMEGTSRKFYNIYVVGDGHLILNWGRMGTAGQTKIEKYTPAEAQIIAKRQVYAKASKGYKINDNEIQFSVSESIYRRSTRTGSTPAWIERALDAAKEDSLFNKQQALVTTHYDKFIEHTNEVLDAAARGEDFDSLLDRWQHLSTAWKELSDKHSHAATAVGMVQQVVSQRLMEA